MLNPRRDFLYFDMNQSTSKAAVADVTAQNDNKVRKYWFVLGCSCLAIGSFYLSIVDLGNSTNLAATQQETISARETTQAASE